MDNKILPFGFRFSGVACGVKDDQSKLDLALFESECDAVCAGMYTRNQVRSASVVRNEQITPSSDARAILINSGIANACTGPRGEADNQSMADQTAQALDCKPEQCFVMSTGVIGDYLPMDRIEPGIRRAVAERKEGLEAFEQAATGMLTTDLGIKTGVDACRLENGEHVHLAAAAKGAGMIGPNMATMLAVVATDARLSPTQAQQMLSRAVNLSFNSVSVEGHMSTSDTVLLMANGRAQSAAMSDHDLQAFASKLDELCIDVAKMIPSDGEGASHLITINIEGAKSNEDARKIAHTVAHSALVKTAIAGADPNWGRIISAVGYADALVDPSRLGLRMNGHTIYREGAPVEYSESEVSRSIADSFETKIDLSLNVGEGTATFWTSDLTVDYVRFNSEYHT